jgi:beta-glucosidase
MVNQSTFSFDRTPHKVVLEHHGRSNWLGGRFRLGIVRHDSVVTSEAKKLAAKADVVVLAVGFDPESESEGADRTFFLPPGQDQLIQEITSANKNAVVVITGGGAVDMNSWLDHVPAVLQAWYPGQEGGTALAQILFGSVNPSGRLPVTFERRQEDNPTCDSYYPEKDGAKVVYKEGVFVGYRGYEHNGKKPLFPFGHGLSYTSFGYRNLKIGEFNSESGRNPSQVFRVSFDVTNTGKREGAEVAQVYVADNHAKVPRPAKELKGFTKVSLKPGETRHVTVALDQRALSYYDADSKQWRADPGEFEVLVGHSSDQIELRGKINWTQPSR